MINLRLVVDRDTGKRKGFGFVEYADQETALSAVRNLNELDLQGRTLRVNIAEQDTKTSICNIPSDVESLQCGTASAFLQVSASLLLPQSHCTLLEVRLKPTSLHQGSPSRLPLPGVPLFVSQG